MPANDVSSMEARRDRVAGSALQSTIRRTVAIHQPNYFPNLAFFHKILHADEFIILDDVQYRRRGFINRNRIKSPQGAQWLTIPLCVKGRYRSPINEMLTVPERNWIATHERTLKHNYARSKYYAEVMESVVLPGYVIARSGGRQLSELNTSIIRLICDYLGIDVPMRKSSEFSLAVRRTERLLQLTQLIGGTAYLSGVSGGKYMDKTLFIQAGVELVFSEHRCPEYPQLWGAFVSRLSMLDALFNCGKAARSLLGADHDPHPQRRGEIGHRGSIAIACG